MWFGFLGFLFLSNQIGTNDGLACIIFSPLSGIFCRQNDKSNLTIELQTIVENPGKNEWPNNTAILKWLHFKLYDFFNIINCKLERSEKDISVEDHTMYVLGIFHIVLQSFLLMRRPIEKRSARRSAKWQIWQFSSNYISNICKYPLYEFCSVFCCSCTEEKIFLKQF